MLAQFAVMGEMYSRIILGRPKPRVGVLSIGEEDHKGNDITPFHVSAIERPESKFHRKCGRQ